MHPMIFAGRTYKDLVENFAHLFPYRLLDILADRKAKKGLSGHVLVNGKRQPHNFKCASAYVIQVSSSISDPHVYIFFILYCRMILWWGHSQLQRTSCFLLLYV